MIISELNYIFKNAIKKHCVIHVAVLLLTLTIFRQVDGNQKGVILSEAKNMLRFCCIVFNRSANVQTVFVTFVKSRYKFSDLA